MSITFAKAPLIELVMELRWIPKGSTPLEPAPIQLQGQQGPSVFLGGTKQEEFYMRAGGELYRTGFDRSERLLPAGAPFALYQPVFRFRSESQGRRSILYQVGYGMFSVNALPPYDSWDKFLPFVSEGVQVLLGSRAEADQGQAFSQVTLRYINFFGEDLTRGLSASAFASEILGISTSLPPAFDPIATGQVKNFVTKFDLPIETGSLTVSVGDGDFRNRHGILLDTSVSAVGIDPGQDEIMRFLHSAHAVIHRLFVKLTEPIHVLMQPQTGGRP